MRAYCAITAPESRGIDRTGQNWFDKLLRRMFLLPVFLSLAETYALVVNLYNNNRRIDL
jgi:hypothetical protein